jgi:NADPH:quinone reductase-like Zn-dependent oxidoreductase
VKTVKKEQRVLPFIALDPRNVEGSWRQYVCVKEELVWGIPDSDEVAAQFIATPWTRYGMLTYLKVPTGEHVLQTAAGSVLGRK